VNFLFPRISWSNVGFFGLIITLILVRRDLRKTIQITEDAVAKTAQNHHTSGDED
jgi:hypothetical protein